MSGTNSLVQSLIAAAQAAYNNEITDTKFYSNVLSLIVPSGTVKMFAGSSAPTGYVFCDGTAYSRTTYLSLFTAIGTTFGSGDGSTTFNVPDYRGIFPRGAGTNGTLKNANGTAFSATLGAYSNDQLQGHEHQWIIDNSAGTGTKSANCNRGVDAGNFEQQTNSLTSNGSNGSPRGGNETAPANLGINFIIAT